MGDADVLNGILSYAGTCIPHNIKKMLFSFSYYYSNVNEKEYSVGKLSAKYP